MWRRPVDDHLLAAAVSEMLSDSEHLTRALLGGRGDETGSAVAGHRSTYPRR